MHIHLKAEIFACARCGFCCHGETTVSLDEQDQERMIRALGLSREETARRYWRVTGSTVQMQVRDGHCIFFDDENNYRTISESSPGIRTDIDYAEFCRILRALLDQSADGRLGT